MTKFKNYHFSIIIGGGLEYGCIFSKMSFRGSRWFLPLIGITISDTGDGGFGGACRTEKNVLNLYYINELYL